MDDQLRKKLVANIHVARETAKPIELIVEAIEAFITERERLVRLDELEHIKKIQYEAHTYDPNLNTRIAELELLTKEAQDE